MQDIRRITSSHKEFEINEEFNFSHNFRYHKSKKKYLDSRIKIVLLSILRERINQIGIVKVNLAEVINKKINESFIT